MHVKAALPLLLTAALVAGPAFAEQDRATMTFPGAPATPRAPDLTLGMAIMSAKVSPTGVLRAGSGVLGPVEHNDTGNYFVYFSRSLTGCSHVVSVSNYNPSPFGADLFYGVADSSAPIGGEGANGVWVKTGNPTVSTPVNLPFSVIVFCPQ